MNNHTIPSMFLNLLFFIGSFIVNAGDSTTLFKLEDFIPTPYKYSSLVVQPHISFQGSNNPKSNRIEYFNNSVFSSNNSAKSSSESFSPSIIHRFDYFSSKFEYYYSNNISVTLDNDNRRRFGNSGNICNYNINKTHRFSYSTNLNNNLYYYIINKFFLGLSLSPYIRQTPYDFSKSTYKSINYFNPESDSSYYRYSKQDIKSNTVNLSLSTDISFGFGRIYNVTNGVVALNILDRINALKKGGQSSVNIQNFAEVITRLKHKRKYDARKALIDDIDSIYTYLKGNGVVDSSYPTARIIMEIADQWQYSDNTQRESGFRYKLYPKLNVTLDWNHRKQTSIEGYDSIPFNTNYTQDDVKALHVINSGHSKQDVESGDHEIQGFICSDYTLKKLINRYFQLNIYLSGKFGLVKHFDDYHQYTSIGFDRAYPAGYIQTDFSLGYYPNTRTTIKLSIKAGYIRELDYSLFDNSNLTSDPAVTIIHDDRNLFIDSSLSLSYYVSPRFSFNINGVIGFRDYYSYEKGANKSSNFSFGPGLDFAIF